MGLFDSGKAPGALFGQSLGQLAAAPAAAAGGESALGTASSAASASGLSASGLLGFITGAGNVVHNDLVFSTVTETMPDVDELADYRSTVDFLTIQADSAATDVATFSLDLWPQSHGFVLGRVYMSSLSGYDANAKLNITFAGQPVATKTSRYAIAFYGWVLAGWQETITQIVSHPLRSWKTDSLALTEFQGYLSVVARLPQQPMGEHAFAQQLVELGTCEIVRDVPQLKLEETGRGTSMEVDSYGAMWTVRPKL